MRTVSIGEVRKHLAELLDEVGSGETIAITRRGREVAHLVPADHAFPALPSRAKERRAMKKDDSVPGPSSVVRMRDGERA